MIECDKLNHFYGDRHVLRDVSFNASAGQTIGIFGHNGCGKSTLLKLIGGSLSLQSGSIELLGKAATNNLGFIRSHLRRDLGVLLQGSSSDEKLSCYRNLEYAAKIYGESGQNLRKKIDDTLALAGLEHRAFDPVKKLSEGMRRRLELYRTFLHSPKVILLDEPTAALDVAECKKFFSFLRSYQRDRAAVVLIASHQAKDLEFCHQVMMMKAGRIARIQSPKEILSSLNYLRCTFIAKEQERLPVQSSYLFDVETDLGRGCLRAKVRPGDLEALLSSELLKNRLSHFSLVEPDISDAYQDVEGEVGESVEL